MLLYSQQIRQGTTARGGEREDKMKIEGIGVINKNKALSILTKEGREEVKKNGNN